MTPATGVDEGRLRTLVPQALARLVRRGEEFAAAEDALQEALLDALRTWPTSPPRDELGWLVSVAGRRLVDARRSEGARRTREEQVRRLSQQGPTQQADDTLLLLFLCCHPDLTPASAVALTLRAVAGLSTREIAAAFLVPEATMAQRISRAKRQLREASWEEPADVAVVLKVLYLTYHAGHVGSPESAGEPDLAAEAIRLTRQLVLASPEPEVRGLLALMLLNHARLPARVDGRGALVTLEDQDRSLWNGAEIAEGVRVLQSALAEERRGPYQVQAAVAALHDDATSTETTDWPQVVEWYDELLALSDDPSRTDPMAVLSRAVAVGHAVGPSAGLHETECLAPVLGENHRWHAARAHLLSLAGDHAAAASAYAEAAERATSALDRDHLVRRAARARAASV